MEKMNTKNVKLDSAQILLKTLGALNLTPPQFAKIVGVSPQSVRDIINGRVKNISQRLRSLIVINFPEVNKMFLSRGEGEPLVKTTPKVVQIANDSHDFSQNVHNIPRACDTCTLLHDAHEQINRLLAIIERLQM